MTSRCFQPSGVVCPPSHLPPFLYFFLCCRFAPHLFCLVFSLPLLCCSHSSCSCRSAAPFRSLCLSLYRCLPFSSNPFASCVFFFPSLYAMLTRAGRVALLRLWCLLCFTRRAVPPCNLRYVFGPPRRPQRSAVTIIVIVLFVCRQASCSRLLSAVLLLVCRRWNGMTYMPFSCKFDVIYALIDFMCNPRPSRPCHPSPAVASCFLN